MPDTIIERGYLDTDYLEGDYLGGEIDHHISGQVEMVINKQTAKGAQVNQVISAMTPKGVQALMQINADFGPGTQVQMEVMDNFPLGIQAEMVVNQEANYGAQALQVIAAQSNLGLQAFMQLVGVGTPLGTQVEAILAASPFVGMQSLALIGDKLMMGSQVLAIVNPEIPLGQQVEGIINQVQSAGMSVKADVLRHALCGVYLEDSYLSGPYLTACMHAFQGMQVNQVNKVQQETGMQVEAHIQAQLARGQQVLMIVDTQTPTGMQANRFNATALGMQGTMVIYNTTQLRVMYDFPSRGTPALLGLNWLSTSTASGDYSPNNVNTDIIEQVFRSAPGSASLVTLTCDTGLPQGVPIDTIAILGHNLTKSATVQVQGSNDNFATPPNITFNMLVELDNMYYISPTFPTSAGQNRYWRFIISDYTNPDTFIEIGTILFGASELFSVSESFTTPIQWGYKHFKDSLNTEGFTSQTNDRALKRFLRLNFNKLIRGRGNFRMLDDMLKEARTALKVLVIPTPDYASRFAVYGKIVQMPEVESDALDYFNEYISLGLEWDESQ